VKQSRATELQTGPSVHKRITLLWPHKENHHYSHVIYRALIEMGFVVDMIDYRELRDKLPEVLGSINSDLVIVGRGEGIPPNLIRNLPCPTLLWYGEHIAGKDDAAVMRLREIKFNNEAFDYVIWFGDNDTDAIQVLRDIGCNRVGYAYPCRFDPTIYRNLDLPKIYDVSFVGTLTPRRKAILEILAKRFKVEFRNIWDVEDQVRFFNQSKIVLHINFAPFITAAYLNMRTFDVVGSGSFMLHEDVVFPGQLEHGRHLVYWRFNDIDDLMDKIEYYLVNEGEREEIARAGYLFVRDNFSAKKAIQALLQHVDFSLYAPKLDGPGYGVARDKFGKETKSLNELYKALEPVTSPQYAQSFYERGKIYHDLERWEKAAEMLEQAIEMDPDFSNAIYLLASSYIRLGREKAAVREMKRLLDIEPLNPEVNIALGELYLRLGDKIQGRFYKEKGLKLSPQRFHGEGLAK